MKTRLHILLLSLCSLALLAACGQNEPPVNNDYYFDIETILMVFEQDGGTQDLHLRCSGDWTANLRGSGFSIDKTSGHGDAVIKVTAEPSTSESKVTGYLEIKDEYSFATIELVLKGVNPDKAAMADLYNSLGGSKLKNLENWGTSAPLEEWSNIALDGDGRVTEIDLYNFGGENYYNIQGKLPESIGNLTHLEQLLIGNESGFTGPIPESIGNLTKLKGINMHSINLTGNLPDVFGNMQELEYIHIAKCPNLGGLLPPSLGECRKLEELTLFDCAFEGTIPEKWCTYDKYINVGGNKLSGTFPAEFYYMPTAWQNFYNCMNQSSGSIDLSNAPHIPGYGPGFHGDTPLYDVVDNSTFNYSEIVQSAKYTVEIFWASWCPHSKILMPKLLEFYKKYHSKGLEVIAIDHYEEEGAPAETTDAIAREAILERGYDVWHNASTAKNTLGSYPMAFPTATVYDQNGYIVFSDEPHDDPVYDRFGKHTRDDLVPFLESLFGPMDEPAYYESKDYSKDGEVLTLQKATKGKGINLVFMGDGYTDRDMSSGGLYEKLMKQSMEEFFAIEPYKSFRDRFNVYAVKVVSKNGQVRTGYQTALESVHGEGSYIAGNIEKCYEYALKVPSINSRDNLDIAVISNFGSLGGTAYLSWETQSGVSFVGSAGNDPSIFGPTLRHEVGGHGFAFLADEYVENQGSPSALIKELRTSEYEEKGWWPNIDFTSNQNDIKWSHLLKNAKYKGFVDVIEGGLLFRRDVWRPSANSMMNHDVEYFNAPSREAIYKRIMELSGETYDFDKFVEYDAVNRVSVKSTASVPAKGTGTICGAPPVVIR